MAREFSVIIERDAEGYYVASVPALRGCHTQATSLDELMVRVREAVELCLEVHFGASGGASGTGGDRTSGRAAAHQAVRDAGISRTVPRFPARMARDGPRWRL